jgi:fucose permease
MVLSFVLFAVAFALYLPAAKLGSLTYFLIASFVSGSANAVLQACVNPYITILGPLESAAKRTSIMGICNKIAWAIPTLFLVKFIGKPIKEMEMLDLLIPFYIIIGVFVVLGVIAAFAPLPEVKAVGEDEDDAAACPYAEGKTSIMQFPHLLLGCLTLFFYVGVETISLSTVQGYATSLENNGIDLLISTEWLTFVPPIGMVIGYICGIVFIPKYLSQDKAMRICAWIALVGSVLVAVLPGEYSIYCILLMALGCSLMWPALWPLAMADLGKFTKKGSALLTMAMAGGAVMPLVRAWVEGMTGSFQMSYWVCVPCFLVILLYGSSWYKIRK